MKKQKKEKRTEVQTYEVLHETQNEYVDNLFEIYKTDKEKARIYALSGDHLLEKKTTMLFERADGSWEICFFETKYGINKNNIIYSSKRKEASIIYTVDGKFWYRPRTVYGFRVAPLKLYDINNQGLHDVVNIVLTFLIDRYSWVKFLKENNLKLITFNTIIKYKLYSFKDVIKHYYKCDYPTAKILHSQIDVGEISKPWWDLHKDYILHFDKIDLSSFCENYYERRLIVDTIKMGRILGQKTNMMWSKRRMKEVHDEWSKKIGYVLIETQKLTNLKISDIYLKFAEWSGYKLLGTNKEMLIEGMTRQHCVATYVNAVNSGSSAIFSIKGFTLELGKEWATLQSNPPAPFPESVNLLKIKQFRGYRNCPAPNDLMKEVQDKIDEYNIILLNGRTLLVEEEKTSTEIGWPIPVRHV